MAEQKDNFYRGLFWGTLLGAGIGTALGMLFAPRKGEDTRRALLSGINAFNNETPVEHPFGDMPVPNSIPPEDGVEPAEVENEAKKAAEKIAAAAKDEADEMLGKANSLLREVKRLGKTNTN
jgi:gas vesicle protein